MPKFLFRFGYEAPDEFLINLETGSDFESSTAFWISTETEALAMEWGKAVAQDYVIWLFGRAGRPVYSWIDVGFAFWIEDDPDVIASARDLPDVVFGKAPDFRLLEPAAHNAA